MPLFAGLVTRRGLLQRFVSAPLQLRDFAWHQLAILALVGISLSLGCGLTAAPRANDHNESGTTAPPAQLPTGRDDAPELLGWTQATASLTELRRIRFTLVVDGARSPLDKATCEQQRSVLAFECRAPLPALSDGRHEIQVVSAFRSDTGSLQESSPSLRLVIFTEAGRSSMLSDPLRSPPPVAAPAGPRRPPSSPMVPWATGLDGPRLLVPASHDRVFFVTGSSQMYSATPAGAAALPGVARIGGTQRILAVAVSPRFEQTRHVFVAWSATNRHRQREVQVRRYTFDQGQLVGETMTTGVPAPKEGTTALMAFGPDGRLYVVLPESTRSTIFRFNEDGSTPAEHGSKGSLFAYGPPNASALAWNPRTSELWCVGTASDGLEILVFPSPANQPAASLPFTGRAPGGTERNRRGRSSRVASLAFLNRPGASTAELLAVVTDGNGEVVKLAVADNGGIRIAGRYPPGSYGRVTELAALGSDVFVMLENPGRSRAATIGRAVAGYVHP